jgi:hypothetical protein
MTTPEIIKLLKKHGYCVTLKISNDKIYAAFPKRAIKPCCEPFINIYKPITEGVSCITAEEINDFIKSPKYAQRTVIFADIARICKLIGYSSRLISFFVNSKEVDYTEFRCNMLPFTLTALQTKKEATLEEMVGTAIAHSFSQEIYASAKKSGVQDGLKVIESILSKGKTT